MNVEPGSRPEIERLLKDVESHDFASAIKVASSVASAKRIAQRHPVVRALIERVREEPWRAEAVIQRARDLSERPVDPRYESPWDAALFALLIVLEESAPTSVQAVAARTASAPQTYLAGRLAHELLARPTSSDTAVGEYVPVQIDWHLPGRVASYGGFVELHANTAANGCWVFNEPSGSGCYVSVDFAGAEEFDANPVVDVLGVFRQFPVRVAALRRASVNVMGQDEFVFTTSLGVPLDLTLNPDSPAWEEIAYQLLPPHAEPEECWDD